MTLKSAIAFIERCKQQNVAANKAQIQGAYQERFTPNKNRSVFVGDGYAFRFSEARTGSFSNTVLSLSALQAYDTRPFVVVVVRKLSVDFLLANSSFLRKVSHSSQRLTADNIKGSFNGTDIMAVYEGSPNRPENFDELFALHAAFSWEENVSRLVEATNAIVGRDLRFRPTISQRQIVLEAPERAAAAMRSSAFAEIEEELQSLVSEHEARILRAGSIDNVNLRGNEIEQALTKGINTHGLGDLERRLEHGRLLVDIKTKLSNRASAPKAYNIDKALEFASLPGSVFAFLLITIDTDIRKVSARLLPILESGVLDVTGIQHHWAGRASRGVTQLSGQISKVSDPNYRPFVDISKARAFLERLLAL